MGELTGGVARSSLDHRYRHSSLRDIDKPASAAQLCAQLESSRGLALAGRRGHRPGQHRAVPGRRLQPAGLPGAGGEQFPPSLPCLRSGGAADRGCRSVRSARPVREPGACGASCRHELLRRQWSGDWLGSRDLSTGDEPGRGGGQRRYPDQGVPEEALAEGGHAGSPIVVTVTTAPSAITAADPLRSRDQGAAQAMNVTPGLNIPICPLRR